MIKQIGDEENVSYRALTSGSRIRRISRVRLKVAIELVDRYGISLAETARQLGVTTSSISKSLARARSKISH